MNTDIVSLAKHIGDALTARRPVHMPRSLAKHIGDALTARRPVHMPRMKMRELGLLLIELKAYREAAATVTH
uniref:Uncharacterized protein n=1 Tax=Pseudomonas aeruginosa TaxID=287 RepID=A0A2Z1GAC4_PSEAI|nr:Hypothetical protein [Pseudomonas aeruginosa]